MRPMNDTARRLERKAAGLGIELVTGYFGTGVYCAGVRVRDACHAFELGALLGDQFGPRVLDRWEGLHARCTIAFPEALVQA